MPWTLIMVNIKIMIDKIMLWTSIMANVIISKTGHETLLKMRSNLGLANNSLEVICKVWGAAALWTVIMANVKIMVDVITDRVSSKTLTQKLNSR